MRPSPAARALSGPLYGVQIGAVASREAALALENALRAREPQLSRPLKMSVEVATVAGRKVYRAVVAGFPSWAEAEGFCRAERRAGRPCLVRAPHPT